MQTNIKRYKWLLPFIFFTISSCSFDHNSSVTQATGTTPANMVIKNPAGYTQPVLASNSAD